MITSERSPNADEYDLKHCSMLNLVKPVPFWAAACRLPTRSEVGQPIQPTESIDSDKGCGTGEPLSSMRPKI